MGFAGSAVAGNEFHNGSGDGRWDNPANWSLGVVPQDATTYPGDAIPAWNNDALIRNGKTALIDSD